MRKMTLELIPPGAKTAKEICDSSGVILFPKGAELNKHLLSILHAKGISEVAVVIERSPAEQTAFTAELTKNLDRRFKNVVGNPLMEKLKQMIFDYRCGER